VTGSGSVKEEGHDSICLDIKDVEKRFPGVTAVDHVSLEIKEGEIFTFLGPSGCGKTTLLRLVAGLENLDHGDILIAGEVVNKLPPFKRDCSTVFQNHALFPHMTVFNNIGFGLVERRLPKGEIKKKVSANIDLVNLEGLEDRYPDQLSGGQQQRVALARSLVLEPMILLLDEPLSSLDRKLRKEMQVELKRIQREVGTSFLNVTHDQKEALSLSDRIAVMNEGKLQQIGTPNEIYENPRTRFVASFMGASNIFSGKVVSRRGGRIELETKEGLRIFAIEPKDIENKNISGVSVHPELIQVGTEENNGHLFESQEHTAFRGRIKEMIYQGDFIELTVVLKRTNKILTIQHNRGAGNEVRLAEGEDFILSWGCHNNNILTG